MSLLDFKVNVMYHSKFTTFEICKFLVLGKIHPTVLALLSIDFPQTFAKKYLHKKTFALGRPISPKLYDLYGVYIRANYIVY
jgi:hypothetical protein